MKPNLLLETIKCEGGIPHHLLYHQKRLEESLKVLGYQQHFLLKDLISPPDEKLYRCRFLYNHETYSIEYIPYQSRQLTTLKLVHDDSIDYALKFADRTCLDTLFEQRQDADDILILKHGHITDTTIANIAFWINNQWLTPKTPLLEGTTRARLLDEGKIHCADIHIDKALSAPRIALFNAMIGFFEMDNGIIK